MSEEGLRWLGTKRLLDDSRGKSGKISSISTDGDSVKVTWDVTIGAMRDGVVQVGVVELSSFCGVISIVRSLPCGGARAVLSIGADIVTLACWGLWLTSRWSGVSLTLTRWCQPRQNLSFFFYILEVSPKEMVRVHVFLALCCHS